MKKNRWTLRAAAMLLLSACVGTTMALAAEAGSNTDPLVTLSYLNGPFLNSILERVDQKLALQGQQTGGSDYTGGTAVDTAASSFSVVTLSDGQTLSGDIGCEVMLRIGSAACVSSASPGLIDETSGAILEDGGALLQNHLYMMTIDGRGVRASADTVKLMVRGGYRIT